MMESTAAGGLGAPGVADGLCKQGLCSQLAQRLALPLFGWLNLDKSPSVTKAQFLIFKMGVIMVSTGSTL